MDSLPIRIGSAFFVVLSVMDPRLALRAGAGISAIAVAQAPAKPPRSGHRPTTPAPKGEPSAATTMPAGPAPNTAPASPSPEDEEKARAHFRLGRAYYDNGDFAKAAVEFEAAYAISQRAALLYNIYLAYRDANDTSNAATALRKYLQFESKVENRGQLESRLAALERSLKENPPPPQPTAAAPAAPAPADPAPAPQPSEAKMPAPDMTAGEPSPALAHSEPVLPEVRSPNQLLPIVLMGAGGALVVGSVVTGLVTLGKRSSLSDAQDECKKAGNCQSLTPARYAQLEDDKSSGKTLALVTDILLFGGLAAGGTGLVLFLLNRGREATPSTTANLACTPGACVANVRGRF